MSDGITDAHRESRFKPKRFIQKSSPVRCNQCIFIARPPPDAQWECTNPLQSESCFDVGVCNFHITLDELATYTRERLKVKLTRKTVCEYSVPIGDHYTKCNNVEWHHSNTNSCKHNGDKSKCEYWMKNFIGGSKVSTKQPRCKHVLDSKCSNIDGFECPFVSMWDIAGKVCRAYEFMPRKFNIVDTSGDHMTPISGPFDSEEEALDYIKSHIKVKEVV